MLRLVANKSPIGLKFKHFIIFKIFLVYHSLCSSFMLPWLYISYLIKYTWNVSQLWCFKIKFHVRWTTWSISIDLVLPILFIAATADVLSIWITMWILWKLLHNAFSPDNALLSSKIFMCCWDSSDQKSPPFLLPAIDAPHPANNASLFNTLDKLVLRIGAKKSIILLSHQSIFALLFFESIINLPKFPLLIFKALVSFISKDL